MQKGEPRLDKCMYTESESAYVKQDGPLKVYIETVHF